MCKYCKFTYIDESLGERSNGVKRIKRIREGHHILDLKFNRYQDDDGTNRNELILDSSVDIGDDNWTVTDAHIEIKYCPFCGEKL